jgi:hypothetical protein
MYTTEQDDTKILMQRKQSLYGRTNVYMKSWPAVFILTLTLLIAGTERHTVNQSFCSCKVRFLRCHRGIPTNTGYAPSKQQGKHFPLPTFTSQWKLKKNALDIPSERQFQNPRNRGSRARAGFAAWKSDLVHADSGCGLAVNARLVNAAPRTKLVFRASSSARRLLLWLKLSSPAVGVPINNTLIQLGQGSRTFFPTSKMYPQPSGVPYD